MSNKVGPVYSDEERTKLEEQYDSTLSAVKENEIVSAVVRSV